LIDFQGGGLENPKAIRILPAPDASAATVAAHAPAQVAVRTFIVK